MAHVFTFGSPEFVFYFTDVSQYNLAVDSNGKVSLIDLDNVIIFDRRKYESEFPYILGFILSNLKNWQGRFLLNLQRFSRSQVILNGKFTGVKFWTTTSTRIRLLIFVIIT